MPLHIEIVLATFAVLFGLGVIATAAYCIGTAVVPGLPWWPLRRNDGSWIRCRYCHFGQAYAREERVRIEDDDLVEVTCYVCHSCSLPQWRVQRSPVLKRAA